MITPAHLTEALTYTNYQELSRKLFAAGKTTGEAPQVNTEFYLHYTKLNLARTVRIERSIVLTEAVQTELKRITKPQEWVVLVESWCGDVPHSLPILQKITEYKPLITLHILLRDKNLDVMDAYLTNGGRSIPKLIAFTHNFTQELFTWGPRPRKLQNKIDELKANGMAFPEIAEQSQRWYNQNKGQEIQQELLDGLRLC